MTVLRDISYLWSILHMVALFFILFEPRYSQRVTLLAGFLGTSALLIVNVGAMLWMGHGIIMGISFFTCTIPSLLIGFALFQLFPDVFLSLFSAEGEDPAALLSIGVPALRTISYCFVAAGFGIVGSSVFQALGHGGLSLAVSVVRQLVVLLPSAFLLARTTGSLDAVWWSFPFAEIFSMILSALFLYKVYQKEIAPLKDPM